MRTLEEIAERDTTNSVTKKDGTLKARVRKALDFVHDKKIYPSYYTGTGRHIRLVSYSLELRLLLKVAGYKITRGNDALRSGQQGEYIKCSKVAFEFLTSLK